MPEAPLLPVPEEPPVVAPLLMPVEPPLLEPPVVALLRLDELPDGPGVPVLPDPDESLMPLALLPDEPLLWAKDEPASMAAEASSAIDSFLIPCSLISCR